MWNFPKDFSINGQMSIFDFGWIDLKDINERLEEDTGDEYCRDLYKKTHKNSCIRWEKMPWITEDMLMDKTILKRKGMTK